MSADAFYRLAPFIQDYIYQQRWDELRPVQVKSIQMILDTTSHVLITSGTASGKTEAAFLPILTDLYNNPSATIGVIYIGPLKALINDQFERLSGLLKESRIPVQSWHGDVSTAAKEKFLKHPSGILQITPESLEAMLIRRYDRLKEFFGDVRYIVIDEAHAFIASERGRQVICQLQRLGRYQSKPARRVGLSATLGDPELAAAWLSGGTDTPVEIVHDVAGKRSLELAFEHFYDYSDLLKKASEESPSRAVIEENHGKFYAHLYRMVRRESKTLIFANSRHENEELVLNLRRIAENNGDDDIYHVHHGAISAQLREAAETAMREPDQPACTAATVTLELGIDIGQLDQVLQVNSAPSVSSFVQRLGRSGRRRGKPARMFFYTHEKPHDDDAPLGEQICWNLLQSIATIQLYLEEKWIEPPVLPHLPFSLLYHQTMSILAASGELKPPTLAERVLTLAPFRSITADPYRDLLRHLIETKHLERTEIGGLIIGLAGERIVNSYRFFAVFEDEQVYVVRHESREIGSIQGSPQPGDAIRLAGRVWRVVDINEDKRMIFVEPSKGRADNAWTGKCGDLHDRVLERIRQVLREDTEYVYLLDGAKERLRSIRELTRKTGLTEHSILPMGGNRFMVLPWKGSRIFATLSLILREQSRDETEPFYIEIEAPGQTVSSLKAQFAQFADQSLDVQELVDSLPDLALQINKYDRYVSAPLLRQSYLVDYLDVEGARTAFREMSM